MTATKVMVTLILNKTVKLINMITKIRITIAIAKKTTATTIMTATRCYSSDYQNTNDKKCGNTNFKWK